MAGSSQGAGSRNAQTSRRSTLSSLARLIPFARPQRSRLVLGFISALVASVLALSIPLVLESVINGPIQSGQVSQIWISGAIVVALGVGEAVFVALRRWFVTTPGTHIEAAMQNAMYSHLQRLPLAFHDAWDSGQLLSREIQDTSHIRRWISFVLPMMIVDMVTVLLGLVLLILWSPPLAMLFIVVAMPAAIVGYRLDRNFSGLARRALDQRGDVATAIEESIHGVRVLRAFGRGPDAYRSFRRRVLALRDIEIQKSRVLAKAQTWLVLLPDLAFALCLIGGVWLAARGELDVGALFGFFATAALLRAPIEFIGLDLADTFETRNATDRVFEVLDEPVTITSPAEPRVLGRVRGELVFHDVVFRYPDAQAAEGAVLNGCSLRVRPGETLALVGLTGSGKTTLTALASRLYDVDSGSILLDGVDIRDLSLDQLRRNVVMAFEDATLFSATIRDNVLLGGGNVSATGRTDADVRRALDVAQAEFVCELPDGLDAMVGEQGLSLSGGQRQRIALARAIAAEPAVLVMDDPLSALDVDTESRVTSELRRLLVGTTTLVVAHRPSTVALADRVALLTDGRVEAVGTHSELLTSNAHYRFVLSALSDDEASGGVAR